MGTDISGWVEIPKFDRWRGVIKIDGLLYRNYLLFELLFGVRNRSFAAPIAEKRGIPHDASPEVLLHFSDSDLHQGTSWVGWDELSVIRWEDYPDITLTTDWQVLFKLMQLLAEQEGIGASRTRLVVGFF
ncbi:MAG: hypothetical protein SF029_09175 [bacterium]|nr:hypothetical protein [bacterium]